MPKVVYVHKATGKAHVFDGGVPFRPVEQLTESGDFEAFSAADATVDVSVAVAAPTLANPITVAPPIAHPGDTITITVPANVWAGTPTPELSIQASFDGVAVPIPTEPGTYTFVPAEAGVLYLTYTGFNRIGEDAASASVTVEVSSETIIATREPSITAALDGVLAQDAVDLGAYVSSAGSVTVTPVYTLGGLVISGTTPLAAPQVFAVTVTVTDDAGSPEITRHLSATVEVGVDVIEDADTTIAITIAQALPSDQDVPITVTAEPWYSRRIAAGLTWPVLVSRADLTAGPVNLVPPVVTGSADVGETLTADGGLWIYAEAGPEPALSYQWMRGAAPISGATGLVYVVDPADAGAAITVVETATSGAKVASSVSNATAIPSDLPFVDDFNRADQPLTASPNWTAFIGSSPEIVGAAVRTNAADAAGSHAAVANVDLPADQYVQVTVPEKLNVTVNGYFYAFLRWQDANNWLGMWWRANGATRIIKSVGGVVTTIVNGTNATIPLGGVIRGEVQGSTLRMFIGTTVVATATDTTFPGAGKAGVGFINARDAAGLPLGSLDTFECGAL